MVVAIFAKILQIVNIERRATLRNGDNVVDVFSSYEHPALKAHFTQTVSLSNAQNANLAPAWVGVNAVGVSVLVHFPAVVFVLCAIAVIASGRAFFASNDAALFTG